MSNDMPESGSDLREIVREITQINDKRPDIVREIPHPEITMPNEIRESDHYSGLRDIGVNADIVRDMTAIVSGIIQIVWPLPEIVRDITEIVGERTYLVQKVTSEVVTESLQSLFENAKQEGE
jgi:hypothetical protein